MLIPYLIFAVLCQFILELIYRKNIATCQYRFRSFGLELKLKKEKNVQWKHLLQGKGKVILNLALQREPCFHKSGGAIASEYNQAYHFYNPGPNNSI